jgi:hypothetical protein
MPCVRSHHKRDRETAKFAKTLVGWASCPPKNTNMTFMNLISEFNELTLTEIS